MNTYTLFIDRYNAPSQVLGDAIASSVDRGEPVLITTNVMATYEWLCRRLYTECEIVIDDGDGMSGWAIAEFAGSDAYGRRWAVQVQMEYNP